MTQFEETGRENQEFVRPQPPQTHDFHQRSVQVHQSVNGNFQRVFPFLILAIILLFTYALFVKVPYLGFYYSYEDEITVVFSDSALLQKGDRLLEINGEAVALRRAKYNLPLFPALESGDRVRLTIERDGSVQGLVWTVPTDQRLELNARLFSTWWMPFIFWLAGTLTWFNIRPRNRLWGLLVAFNMLIAIYLSALNGPSLENLYFSVPLSRLLGCLSLPLFIGLHWNFPRPMKRLPNAWFLGGFLVTLLIGLLVAFDFLPSGVSIAFGLLAVLGSILVLIYKSIFQSGAKVETRFILAVFLAVFIPSVATTIAYSYLNIFLDHFAFSGAYYSLPALPSAYFLVMLHMNTRGLNKELRRIQVIYSLLVGVNTLLILIILLNLGLSEDILGSSGSFFLMAIISVFSFFIAFIPLLDGAHLSRRYNTPRVMASPEFQLRTNQFLTPYLFMIVVGIFVLAFSLFFQDLHWIESNAIQFAILTGLFASITTLILYPVFQRKMDRMLFGISQLPSELIEMFSQRITTTLSLRDLSNIMHREVTPSLMIRQSALLVVDENRRETVLYAHLAPGDQLPSIGNVMQVLPRGQSRGLVLSGFDGETALPGWIRVLFPLQISGKQIGFWLLGARDPDDGYSLEDLNTLQIIAHQTAVALANIMQTRQLHSIYQEDIDRVEVERVDIARELHDQVLTEIARLVMQISSDQTKETLLASSEHIGKGLRQAIQHLRPTVLDYGLGHAVQELANQLRETYTAATIEVVIQQDFSRYDPKVERHIYRILQQAGENALRHSEADTIYLSGTFKASEVDVTISDNGAGFDYDDVTLSHLLEGYRYGLVGIHERAELIHAHLSIETAIGEGTCVRLHWEA